MLSKYSYEIKARRDKKTMSKKTRRKIQILYGLVYLKNRKEKKKKEKD